MEYSVRLEGDALLENIQTAYDRAELNAERATELAADSEWLWGSEASFRDYADQRPLHHQLTGEIDRLGTGYRGDTYWMCSDPIAKELIPDFPGFVHFGARRHLTESQDQTRDAESRTISLDNAKQYALALFHAAQYPARSRLLETDEHEAVETFSRAATHATRAFYGSVLGWGQEFVDAETAAASECLDDPALAEHVRSLPVRQFKTQELDQPLTILMSSLLAVEKYPDTEVVYALPAGGTQHAIVTQMLYERKTGVAPELHFLPISTHSLKPEALAGTISPSVEQVVRHSDPSDKHILVCEDNSNSGTTVSLASDVLEASSPASCNISIVEFDPKRLEVKNRNLTPLGHVANFGHEDFDTAVGIVPITTGKYPDAQLRKVIPLRRQRHQVQEQLAEQADEFLSYEAIPDGFMDDFNRVYKDTLRYCGDTHGYRNPFQVAATIVRHYEDQGLFVGRPVSEKYSMAQRMARAAIEYPYMPDDVRRKLSAGEESLDYTPDGPWIRAGAMDFMRELLEYAQETDSQVLIWTKGDGSYYSNPPYVGAEEQQLRFTTSGLEQKFHEAGFFDTGHGSFLAHSKKAPLLGTRVLPDMRRRLPHVTDVVIVDDAEKNLAEAGQEARRFGYVPHPINPLIGDSGRARLPALTEFARQRRWGDRTAFIIDMDDTLLHEGFRKYHQPRNMALALLNATAAPRR